MQLIRIVGWLFLLSSCSLVSFAQKSDTSKVKLDDIEVSFLMSYYTQDGNHSPVTGGRGTEELSNVAPSIVANVPIDSVRSYSITTGFDVYSSASSDNINNPYVLDGHVSSASSQDVRVYANGSYKKKYNAKKITTGVHLGVSREYDVTSFSGGVSIAKSSKDKNRELSFKGMYYYDSWKLIFPVELRNGNESFLDDNIRQSMNFTVTGSAIINTKLSASFSSDLVLQNGLLSTPFHRVYFKENTAEDGEGAVVERLPDNRTKIPVGVRANYYLNDRVIVNSFYRYYWDSWDMTGHTFEIELPVTVSQTLRVYPFYRYHSQTAAKYFGEYKTLSITDEFYTSDFDLSELTSQKYGVGISYDPLFGLFRYKALLRKRKVNVLKSIDFRYAHYVRSDGLSADIVTMGLNFRLKR